MHAARVVKSESNKRILYDNNVLRHDNVGNVGCGMIERVERKRYNKIRLLEKADKIGVNHTNLIIQISELMNEYT